MKPRPSTWKKDEHWFRIPLAAKPSKGTCDVRDWLTHGFIDHGRGQSWLIVSNGYLIVRLPVTFPDGLGRKQIRALVPHGFIVPADALKALDKSKTGRFRIVGDQVEVEGGGTYMTPKNVRPPSRKFLTIFEDQVPEHPIEQIGLNPDPLKQLAEVLGVPKNHGVALSFRDSMKPMTVTPLGGHGVDGEALLMPIRINPR